MDPTKYVHFIPRTLHTPDLRTPENWKKTLLHPSVTLVNDNFVNKSGVDGKLSTRAIVWHRFRTNPTNVDQGIGPTKYVHFIPRTLHTSDLGAPE